MDDPKAPDFAMLRAVEILAQMHERARTRVNPPPQPLDFAIALQSERLELRLEDTTRASVEELLGTAFSYPVRGWHTYAVRARPRSFLSLFYRGGTLLAAEIYVPRAAHLPQIALVDAGDLRLEPGGVAIGSSVDAMPDFFTLSVSGPAKVVYDCAYEARFEGNVAYAMGRGGRIERIALYSGAATAG